MIEIDDIGTAAFIVATTPDGSFVYEQVNVAAERLTGRRRADLVGHSPSEIYPPDLAALIEASFHECVRRRTSVDNERSMVLPRGTLVVRTTLTPLMDGGATPVDRLLGVSVDVTEQHQLSEDLKRANARLAIAVDVLGGIPWYFDAGRGAFEFSPAFDRILGLRTPASMPMEEWLCHVHPEDREDTCFTDILAGRIEQGAAEFRVIDSGGDVRWLRCRRRAVAEAGTVAGIAGILLDVTQEKRREAVLSAQAASDPLTGLPNRRRFDEAFAAARERAAAMATGLSVLMIDVDHFKRYNDIYGHLAGDTVLRRLARCLRQVVEGHGGLVARYGGEEFVAVLQGTDTEGAAVVAQAILREVERAGEVHTGTPGGRLSVSVGVAGQAGGHRQPANLVELADVALYRAKADGRACYRVMVASAPPAASAA